MVVASLWNAGVQVENRSGMSRHPSFLICLYKPGGEGGWDVDWGSRDCLRTSVLLLLLSRISRARLCATPGGLLWGSGNWTSSTDRPPIPLGWARGGEKAIQRENCGPNGHGARLTISPAHVLKETRSSGAPCRTDPLVTRRGVGDSECNLRGAPFTWGSPTSPKKKITFSQLSSWQ